MYSITITSAHFPDFAILEGLIAGVVVAAERTRDARRGCRLNVLLQAISK